jgi:hypothetical protein
MEIVVAFLRGRMTAHCSNLHRLIFLLLMSVVTALPLMAQQSQQGQYHLSYSPIVREGGSPQGGLATYSPIKAFDGARIQLRGDDGQVYTFNLTPETIFCQGDKKTADSSFLTKIGKKVSVTVLTNDDDKSTALVLWDRAPSTSISDGKFVFALPPMCK